MAVFKHAFDFVKEKNARTTTQPNSAALRASLRLSEQLADPPLALSDFLIHQVTDLGTYKVQMSQLRAGARKRRFSRSRRTVEQNSGGQRDGELFVLLQVIEFDGSDLPIQAGVDDGFDHLVLQRLAAADGLENVSKRADGAEIGGNASRRNRILQNGAIATVFLNRLQQAECAAARRILRGVAAVHGALHTGIDIAPGKGGALQSQIIDEVRLPGFRLLRIVEFDKESDEMAEEKRAIALTGSNELDL